MDHTSHSSEGDHALTPEELAHRKRMAKRWAWILGGAALLIYSVALSLPR